MFVESDMEFTILIINADINDAQYSKYKNEAWGEDNYQTLKAVLNRWGLCEFSGIICNVKLCFSNMSPFLWNWLLHWFIIESYYDFGIAAVRVNKDWSIPHHVDTIKWTSICRQEASLPTLTWSFSKVKFKGRLEFWNIPISLFSGSSIHLYSRWTPHSSHSSKEPQPTIIIS